MLLGLDLMERQFTRGSRNNDASTRNLELGSGEMKSLNKKRQDSGQKAVLWLAEKVEELVRVFLSDPESGGRSPQHPSGKF